MACGVKIWYLMSIMLSPLLNFRSFVHGEPQVPCYFIFGDSLVDNGNNNALVTLANVNFSPYGIDFPVGPTGRFTNGRTQADIIGELLGFDSFIPPFATTIGSDILKGVNYASGGAGIRSETAKALGGRISLKMQLINHKVIVSLIELLLLGNKAAAKDYLSKCIYSVGLGSNDYLNNYLQPQFYSTSRKYTPDQYAAILIQQYSFKLRSLYKHGARKIAIHGLGQIGCIPAELATHATNGSACVDTINNAVQLFDKRLKPLVDDLNKDLHDAKFIYINTTSITSGNLLDLGIIVLNTPCCQVSTITGICIPGQAPCSNRTEYAFWDSFHPTEIINLISARRAYNALLPTDTYPIDIRHLAKL
ncbi:unnamed protein product [Ilex paraguariensis]|uniref:GDSL esterase/lipase n=1 Tax=Ilex paraguariensis TaxID=185542 RepID=A0ABC8SF35_9AQUA